MNAQDTLQAYIEATNTHDFENVRQVLHDDALFWFTNQTCRTHSEIQVYFESTWAVIKEEAYSAIDIRWLHADDTSASCVYVYQYEGYYEGQLVSGSGRATNVFKKTDAGWKLIHEHLSKLT
ncbi:YybH family protein [Jeotgalibacillus terrae]|uniref:YybH family protein n=1 Tax=Jeotgalibacillus terrae TaxID=587735 RepID=A0ABW5ZH84_9BACL|nr:nuclear transport factor 2 family protein [Jeotgalibacillus terrae]MBM7578736.1 ketosteroid isomerase-like protein [Jeotgalibacillus terrae]